MIDRSFKCLSCHFEYLVKRSHKLSFRLETQLNILEEKYSRLVHSNTGFLWKCLTSRGPNLTLYDFRKRFQPKLNNSHIKLDFIGYKLSNISYIKNLFGQIAHFPIYIINKKCFWSEKQAGRL